MTTILPLHEKKRFTLDEASSLLPLLQRITRQANEEIEKLLSEHSFAKGKQREQLDEAIHDHFHRWQEKMHRLGGVTKGMWLVDFDNGSGYLCWKYPETEISHYHGYEEGFSSRVPLQ